MTGAIAVGRRRFLGLTAGAAAAFAWPVAPARAARRLMTPRGLSLHNLHTGEALETVYWDDGRYLLDALRGFDRLLRDHHTGDVHPIDPRLLDLLAALQSRLDAPGFDVISGYRSPRTNALLASLSEGVARHSFHIRGKAIDIRLPGCGLDRLRAAAISLHVGGVGYYPQSDFMHLDTGPIRHW